MDYGEPLPIGVESLYPMSVHPAIVIVQGDLKTILVKVVAFLTMTTHWLYATTLEQV